MDQRPLQYTRTLAVLCVLLLLLSTPLPVLAQQSNRYYHEGLQLLQEGELPLATQRFRQALLQGEDRAEIWFALGVALYQQQDLTGAHQAYTSGLRLLPDRPIQGRLRSGLGDIYFEQQNFSQAIRAYEQALEIQPNWSGVRLKLATALLREQRFAEALVHSEWLQNQPLPPAEGLYLRSLIYLAQQDLEAAIPSLEKLASYPEHAFNARQMLTWLYPPNREQDYLANAQALKAMAANYPAVYRVLGFSESQRYFNCYLKSATPCQVADYLETLQRWRLSGVNTDSAYIALGNYYQLQHQWDAAESAFRRAAQRFPERLHYTQKARLMARAQNKSTPSLSISEFETESPDQSLWYSLSTENEAPTELFNAIANLEDTENHFWKGYFQAPWFTPPSKATQKLWQKTESTLPESAEKKIIQSWRLWQAGQTQWALKTLESAQQNAPQWWLSYGLWSLFARDLPHIQDAHYQRITEIAYTLNPGSLTLAELRFHRPLAPEERLKRLREVLQTFPEHATFQQAYLETLQLQSQ